MENSKKKKDLKVITGNGKDLKISPVYEHLSDVKPKAKEEKKNIIIPKPKKENK